MGEDWILRVDGPTPNGGAMPRWYSMNTMGIGVRNAMLIGLLSMNMTRKIVY